jgi:tetratricopeptide (TPR) repeat protein
VRALSAGQYAQAIERLRRASKLAPANPGIAFNLGLACFRAGRYADAIAPLERALSDPNSADKARFLLGTAYYQTGKFSQAAAALEPLRANPAYAENALYILEESYRKSRNGPGAEQAFADLLRRYPDSALVHKLLGTAHDSQGHFQEALSEFQQAAQRDPALPEVKFNIGLLYLKLHDDASARKWIEQELAINPCFAMASYYLGEIQRRANQLEAAAESYRKAIRCELAYPEAHLALGTTLQALGQDADALRMFRRAAELAPRKAEVQYQLARALAKAGLSEEAGRVLEKARQLQAAQDAKDVADFQRKSAGANAATRK